MKCQPTSSNRLVSLDVFRGLAIAGMIIVNTPGSWQHVYPLLRHAPWNGCGPADLVFPFFLFVLGASLHLSHLKSMNSQGFFRCVLKRAMLLFFCGFLLNSVTEIHDWLNRTDPPLFSQIRIMGVLQRISFTYLIASLLVRNVSQRVILMISISVLLGYWGMLVLVPVPGYGQGNLSPEGSLAAYLDRLLLTTAHIYRGGLFEPEGLLSTLPAVVTVFTGFFTSQWLSVRHAGRKVAMQLILAGCLFLALGRIWAFVFPINKVLWSSSFVVYSTGWALLVLACCYAAIELMAWNLAGKPFEVLGRNSILIYAGTSLLTRTLQGITVPAEPVPMSLYGLVYQRLFAAWAGQEAGSFLFSLAFLVIWWLIAQALYQLRWFVRV